jgi:hypothetical protein
LPVARVWVPSETTVQLAGAPASRRNERMLIKLLRQAPVVRERDDVEIHSEIAPAVVYASTCNRESHSRRAAPARRIGKRW